MLLAANIKAQQGREKWQVRYDELDARFKAIPEDSVIARLDAELQRLLLGGEGGGGGGMVDLRLAVDDGGNRLRPGDIGKPAGEGSDRAGQASVRNRIHQVIRARVRATRMVTSDRKGAVREVLRLCKTGLLASKNGAALSAEVERDYMELLGS
jgi:hypothetical protein